MKFKKTKLTALAMSVLMAMSTITSVTWAADFTDGAPSAEASVEVISDGEAEIPVEAPIEEVTNAQAAEIVADGNDVGKILRAEDIRFYYNDARTKVMASYIVVTQGDRDVEIKSDRQEVEASISRQYETKPASCEKPAQSVYYFELDGNTYVSNKDNIYDSNTKFFEDSEEHRVYSDYDGGYIFDPNSKPLGDGIIGHRDRIMNEEVVEAATCINPGKRIVYEWCADCKRIKLSSDAYGMVITSPLDLYEYVKENGYDLDNPKDGVSDVWFDSYSIDKNAHVYDKEHEIVVSNSYYNNSKYQNVLADLRVRPYNCHWVGDPVNGKMVAYTDEDFGVYPNDPAIGPFRDSSSKDAYYYTVYECKYCGMPIYADKKVLRDVTGVLDGIFYEPLENIQGFLYVDPATGKLAIYYVPAGGRVKKETVVHGSDGLPIPVMTDGDCTKIGYYKITTYQSDTHGPVSSVLKEVKSKHAWGSTEIAPKNTKIDASGTLSKTEDDNLLKDLTNNEPNHFVVVRDAQGNVTEAKSKNCVTKAKYQLYHTCLVCGAVEKVGDLKTADVNPDMHQWPNTWGGPVDADNVYIDLRDGENHMKYTYQYRVCELCGKRDLKLYSESKEKHRLIETKIEGGDEKDPTCGEDGYYTVQMVCPCGFADKNTIKKTVKPATDRHDFGDNETEMIVVGNIQVGGRTVTEKESSDPTHIVYGTIVRKCKVCGKYDSNGIDNTIAGMQGKLSTSGVTLPAIGGTVVVDDINTYSEEKLLSDYIPAKADPTTGVPYSCSVGKITVTLKWAGKVDGSPKILEKQVTVPYYPTETTYAGARAHEPGEAKIENKVEATATQAGSYDKVIYCRVCGDEISRETITVDPETIIPAPTVKAKAANYNTINLTWNAVEGATSYDVYYRSAALGVNDWTLAKSVTGTSFNYSGLITGVKYRFTVSAVAGENSSEIGVSTSVATPKLAAPEIKTVTAVKKGTKVTWSKVDGANGYIIQSKTASGKWTRVATLKKGAKVSWTDKKAVSGTTYRVRAYRTVDAPNISKNNVYGPFSAAK